MISKVSVVFVGGIAVLGGLAVAVLPPSTLIAALVLGVVCVVMVHFERAGGVLLGVFLSWHLLLAAGVLGFTIPGGVREFLIVVWTGGVIWRRRTEPMNATPVVVLGLLFMGWSVLMLGLHKLSASAARSALINIEFLLPVVVCALFRDSRSPRFVVAGLSVGVLVAVMASAFGLSYARRDLMGVVVNTSLWDARQTGLSIARQTWAFGEPNNAGLALAMATGTFASVRASSRSGAVATWLLAGSAFFATLLTFSRSALLMVLVAVALQAIPIATRGISRNRRVVAVVLGVMLVLLVTLIAVPVLSTRILGIVDLSHPSNAARLEILQTLGRQVFVSPVWGHGWGSLGVFASGTGQPITVGDNHYLQYAYQIGLVGLALFIGLLLSILKGSVYSDSPRSMLDMRALNALLVGYIVAGFFANAWEMLPAAAFFWFVAATVLYGGDRSYHRESARGWIP